MTGTRQRTVKELLADAEHKLASARYSFQGEFYGDAASRAYYAAFHAVSAVLFSEGRTFASHSQTLSAFNRDFILSGRIAGIGFKDIKKLFDDRQSGDYEGVRDIGRLTAEKDITSAANIVHICRLFLFPPEVEEKPGMVRERGAGYGTQGAGAGKRKTRSRRR